MKKFFLLFIFFAQIYNINALEYDYSEWSEEYPNDVNEILIESEDRFLCYSEEKENIEYLIKEEIKDKLYDESDYQYYESEEDTGGSNKHGNVRRNVRRLRRHRLGRQRRKQGRRRCKW